MLVDIKKTNIQNISLMNGIKISLILLIINHKIDKIVAYFIIMEFQ